jgi:hypothetical protein
MTREESERRIAALQTQYRYLFDSGDSIGFDFLPGWFAILEELCQRIDEALSPEEKQTVRFLQIKEKLGGLRAYLNIAPVRLDFFGNGNHLSGHINVGPHPDIYSRLAPFVRAAEEQSYRTCIFCGASGVLRRDRDWILTLCDTHAEATYWDLRQRFDEITTP